ncbi:hypothetical protein BMG05_03750 [Mycobacterium malmoense]|nr:hypothetical protein BMG05_03750 [Mycobacterium malmoense]
MCAGIHRDVAHGTADGGGELLVGAMGMLPHGIELILQQLLLGSQLHAIAPNPGVADLYSPIRRDGPTVSIGGPLDLVQLALACTHVALGARHRRGYLSGLLTVRLDVAPNLTQIGAKRFPGLPLPAAENVVDLLQVLP